MSAWAKLRRAGLPVMNATRKLRSLSSAQTLQGRVKYPPLQSRSCKNADRYLIIPCLAAIFLVQTPFFL